MKKILIYIDSMSPAGGIERVISNLSNQWASKYIVTIIVKDNPQSFYKLADNITMRTINKPLSLNMKNRFSRILSLLTNIIRAHGSLKSALIDLNPEIIYTASPINSLEICMCGKAYSSKLIISEHGSKLGYNRIYQIIKSYIYPKAYKISVPTTLDTQLYKEEGFPAIFIPHTSTFKATKKNRLDSKYVLNIGRLTSDKQQMTLLKIWKEVVSNLEFKDWKLIIVGKGEEEDNLRTYIRNNNISENVEIMEPSYEVEKFFKQASIFAFTSKFEGFGMVLLEAMSFGIPCVSFNCPSGPRDIIKNNINGFLVENNNLDEYKEKLSTVMSNATTRKRLGEKAFKTAIEWDNNAILDKWDKSFDGK